MRYLSDHTPLTFDISITEKFIQDKRCTIIKNSKEEEKFTLDLIQEFKNIDTSNISNKDTLELIIQKYKRLSETAWVKHSYCVNITKHSKDW